RRLRARGSDLLGDQRVDAVLVVYLPAGDRRVEHAHAPDLLADPDLLRVMVVQRVQRALGPPVHLAGGRVLALALTVRDEHGLDVIGVPDVVLAAVVQRALVHREALTSLGQDGALGAPVLRLDVVVSVGDLVERANEHGRSFRGRYEA